jgi:capsular exopolysaccharide synthesis family protein
MTIAQARVNHRLVSLTQPASFEAEQYQSLRLSLQRLKKERDIRMIALTSPTSGDGKTLTAINLAGALARGAGTRVLLIEADLRRPVMASQLGTEGRSAPGIADVVRNPGYALKDAVQPLDFGFSVVVAGSSSSSAAYQVFNSPRFEALLREAREHYDYVILDTPPVVPVSDCRLLAPWVDGLLLVVSAHRTPRKLVEESLNLLDRTSVLGIVFNRDDHPWFGYHRRRYYPRRAPAAGGA